EIGQRPHAAALHPSRSERAERRIGVQVEPAVAGEQRRMRAIELQALDVRYEHRNLGSILGGIPHLLHFVAVGLYWYRRLKPYRMLPGGQVIAIDSGRDVKRIETEKSFTAFPGSA